MTKEELLRLKDQTEAEGKSKIRLETKKETLVEEILTTFSVKDSKELVAKITETKSALQLLNQNVEIKSDSFREKWDV